MSDDIPVFYHGRNYHPGETIEEVTPLERARSEKGIPKGPQIGEWQLVDDINGKRTEVRKTEEGHEEIRLTIHIDDELYPGQKTWQQVYILRRDADPAPQDGLHFNQYKAMQEAERAGKVRGTLRENETSLLLRHGILNAKHDELWLEYQAWYETYIKEQAKKQEALKSKAILMAALQTVELNPEMYDELALAFVRLIEHGSKIQKKVK